MYSKGILDHYFLEKIKDSGIVPEWLDLEINTDCNIVCKKCFRTYAKIYPEHMSFKFAMKIIREFAEKGGQSLRLSERGEPTLSPMLVDCVKYAKLMGVPRVLINTNCVNLTPKLSKKLVEAGITQITCSIDSCEKETYELLQGKNYEKVIRNIKSLKEIADGQVFIRIQMNLQEENRREAEIGLYEEFFKPYANEVHIKPTFEVWNFDKDVKLNTTPCMEPWRRIVVLINGDCMICPAGINYFTDERFLVGNLHEKSLEQIWNGRKMRKIRKWHLEGQLDKMWCCKSCRIRRLYQK